MISDAGLDTRIIAAYLAGDFQSAIATREGIPKWRVASILRKRGVKLSREDAIARMIVGSHTPEANRLRSEAAQRPLRQRFEAKIGARDGPGECWLWKGATTPEGRPTIFYEGKTRSAAHVALILAGKPRPEGLCALHKCDVPLCVNPDHLWWGTHQENTHDAIAKGRFNFANLALGPTWRLRR